MAIIKLLRVTDKLPPSCLIEFLMFEIDASKAASKRTKLLIAFVTSVKSIEIKVRFILLTNIRLRLPNCLTRLFVEMADFLAVLLKRPKSLTILTMPEPIALTPFTAKSFKLLKAFLMPPPNKSKAVFNLLLL